jgi:hypothetical protein
MSKSGFNSVQLRTIAAAKSKHAIFGPLQDSDFSQIRAGTREPHDCFF